MYVDLSKWMDPGRGLTTVEFCRGLLEEEHVAFADGRDFEDPETDLGGRRFRISYAGGERVATEAMERTKRYFEEVWKPLLANSNTAV